MNYHDPDEFFSKQQDSGKEISFEDFFSIIKSKLSIVMPHRRFIITFSIVIGLSSALYTKYIVKPTFTATYQLFFEQENSGGMSSALRLASSFGLGIGGIGSSSSTTVQQFLTSRDNVSRALRSYVEDDLLIDRYYQTKFKKDEEFAQEFALKFDYNKRYTDSIISAITHELNVDNLTTSLDEEKGSVTLSVSGNQEDVVYTLSKVLVNNAEKVFIDFRRKKSKSAVLAFQNKVDSLESSIDATLLRMGEYEDQNNALVSSVDKMKRLRLTIDMEALKVSYGEYIKGLEMSKVELLNLEPTFKYFDAPTYPLRKKEKSSVLAGFLGLFVSVILIILVLIAREEVGKFKVNS